MADWLDEVREQLGAHQRGAPNPADWHIPRLLACAEVLERLVAGHRKGGINEATWEAAEKALREGRDG